MKQQNKSKDIGMHTLKAALPDIILYILLMIILALTSLSIWGVLVILTIYIAARQLFHKIFSFKSWLKGCAFLYAFIGCIYLIKYFVGGIWAVIIVNVAGVAWIAYSNRSFIKQMDTQIKRQLDIIIQKRKGGMNGR